MKNYCMVCGQQTETGTFIYNYGGKPFKFVCSNECKNKAVEQLRDGYYTFEYINDTVDYDYEDYEESLKLDIALCEGNDCINEAVTVCSKCGKPLCVTCSIECSDCGDILCLDCSEMCDTPKCERLICQNCGDSIGDVRYCNNCVCDREIEKMEWE